MLTKEQKRIRQKAKRDYSYIKDKYKSYKDCNNGSFRFDITHRLHEAVYIWKWLHRDNIQCRIIHCVVTWSELLNIDPVHIYIEIDTDPDKPGYYTGIDIVKG